MSTFNSRISGGGGGHTRGSKRSIDNDENQGATDGKDVGSRPRVAAWWRRREPKAYGPTAVSELLATTGGHYVSDVIHCDSVQDAALVSRNLRVNSKSFSRQYLFICVDGSHVHVIHDCNFHQNNCKCSFIRKTQAETGYQRRHVRGSHRPLSRCITPEDASLIYEYFQAGERRIIYCKIKGEVSRLVRDPDRDESEGPEAATRRDSSEQLLEAEVFDSERQLLYRDKAWRSGTTGLSDDRRGRKAIAEKRKEKCSGVQEKLQKISALLKENPCVPISSILEKDCWLDNDYFKYLDYQDSCVRKALTVWQLQLCNWKIHDFHTLYSSSNCKPLFSSNNIDEYYYTPRESLDIMISLLEFQFEGPEAIGYFVNDLFNVLEKRVPKLNTLCVISPPSAGKTFFFDAITGYYLNIGHMSTINRNNVFGFQDIPGRRVVVWNEPNYSNDYKDALKELLGGDQTNVSVKFKAEQVVNRTPFIITSNHNSLTILHDTAFEDRMVTYYWSSASFLKKYDKKLHPLATYELFKHYGFVSG
uniref:NS1 n=1 Tax=uncultured densovirus TaxID=748192 RepID=A0A7L7YQJ7_9VIRU|nr:NS1 [uncultured densovirus]